MDIARILTMAVALALTLTAVIWFVSASVGAALATALMIMAGIAADRALNEAREF